MAEYSSFKLTNAGLNLRTRCDSLGESLEFTKFELGNGFWVYPESVPAMAALDNSQKVQPVAEVKQLSETEYQVKMFVVDEDLPETGFDMTEIGLFAKTVEQDTEILYGVVYAGVTADYLPAAGDTVAYDYLINIIVETGSPDVTVVTVNNARTITHDDAVELIDESKLDKTKGWPYLNADHGDLEQTSGSGLTNEPFRPTEYQDLSTSDGPTTDFGLITEV